MSSFSSFDIISVVLPNPKIFLCIPASAADAPAVNPNRIKTLLANGLITFFINGSTVFNNGPRSLPRIPPDCIILDNLLFDNLYQLINYLQNIYENLQIIYYLAIIYGENLSQHQNYVSYLMIISKLLLFYVLLQTLIY